MHTPIHVSVSGGRIVRSDGETVLQPLTAVWREATPAAPTTIKNDDPEGGRTMTTPVRPLQGRSLLCHIPAGGAFRATQRLAFVGQLRRPSASVRVLRPYVYLSHTGRTRRSAPTSRRLIGKYTYTDVM